MSFLQFLFSCVFFFQFSRSSLFLSVVTFTSVYVNSCISPQLLTSTHSFVSWTFLAVFHITFCPVTFLFLSPSLIHPFVFIKSLFSVYFASFLFSCVAALFLLSILPSPFTTISFCCFSFYIPSWSMLFFPWCLTFTIFFWSFWSDPIVCFILTSQYYFLRSL